jgi:polyisoprenoid-binding protein YceI
MKITNTFTGLALAIVLASCGGATTEKAATAEKEVATTSTTEEATKYNVETSSSIVNWSGSISTGGYGHEGTLNITEGTIALTGESISAGSFTIDVNSMSTTDANYSEGHESEKFVGHLKSADFFDTENSPTATFVIKGQTEAGVVGTLTIRGKSNEETVTGVTVATAANGDITVTGNLTFNRQKYDVAYVSAMKDMVISDDIKLAISLTAKK